MMGERRCVYCHFYWYILLQLLVSLSTIVVNAENEHDPYNDSVSILDIIKHRGYPVELYQNIRTEDDYLLDVQRIPHGKKPLKNPSKKPPVVFMPPLMTSAEVYVLTPKNLPFMLADAGFDIWLCNPRGSLYSRKHAYLSTNLNSSYWNYTWHQKGFYDLPACIDLALNETGSEQVFLIGYSEGTTTTFVLFTERPEYNRKARMVVELAPSVFLSHTFHKTLRRYTKRIDQLRSMFLTMGIKGAYFDHDQINVLMTIGNASQEVTDLCVNLLKSVDTVYHSNYHPCQVIAAGMHGVSLDEVTHYAQLINSGVFKQFDYGPEVNKIKYGSEIPPSYDLSKFVAPVALYHSPDDYFSAPKDMEILKARLTNVAYEKVISGLNFSHVDFIAHENASRIIYKDVLKLFKSAL